MAKFRKKPVEVEAMRFDGTFESWDAIINWANAEIANTRQWLHGDGDGHLVVPTREGEMRADAGDWIIREPFATDDRHYYPCKPDIFEATYEPAERESREQKDG